MLVRARHFYLLQNVQIGCGDHLASYSVGTGVLPRGETAGSWS